MQALISSMSPLRWSCWTVFVVVLAAASYLGAADDPASLRYRWKVGQTYAYRVTIEVDQGDYFDILSGTPTFTVSKGDKDATKLTLRGSLAEKQQAKPGKRLLFKGPRRSPFSPFTGVGGGPGRGHELTVNERGEVISSQGSSQLPFLLGNLAQLMLDPLPKEGEKTWKLTRDINITLSEGRPRPILRTDDRKLVKATQEISYAVEQSTGKTATIKKRYEMKTAEMVNDKPRFEIQGEGTLTFDLEAGVPSKLVYQHKVWERDAKSTEETPVQVTYQLLDEAERKQLAATTEGAALFPNVALTAEQQTQLVADLKSGDKARFRQATQLLATKDPVEPNKEIAQALEGFLGDKDQVTRTATSRALAKWATTDTVPALVKALDDESILVRHQSIDALARLKAPAAAEALAKCLGVTQDRTRASQALQAMGPAAETAVLKMAEDKEWMVRSEVCKVLKAIGTEKSIPALTTLRNDPQIIVKAQATQAIEAINKRK